MEKGCILPFPDKGDLGITKDFRGIALKVYYALLFNHI